MKCLLCEEQVNEKQQFPGFAASDGRVVEDTVARLRHESVLRTWRHVTLTAQVGGGSMTLDSGHVCPRHELKDVAIGHR